ncbi:putative Ig domain-containing protein [Hamadaea tsunoensis]|uniref:putative Ig domain-containing protein n=1 Tax=Hamadaea tsunoensis TaxID=53368 RepID=UPI00041704E9|nr:putative Ig domain-containing protein [Hamadaea tsunoensis]
MRFRRVLGLGSSLLLGLSLVTAVPAGPATAAAGTVTISDRAYQAVDPARILDTRSGLGAAGPVGAGQSITLKVTGTGGVPASGVGAVVLNVTGTGATAATFVSEYPAGGPLPTASILNLTSGETSPNLVVAKPDAQGRISFYNYAGGVHLIADVLGWFAAAGAFTGLTPVRVLDTRSGLGAPAGAVGPQKTISLRLGGVADIPDTAGAVVLNLTGTAPTAATFVTAYPSDAVRPTASNLNLTAGQTRPNLVIAKLGADGVVKLYNNSGSVHLIADVVGWIAAGGDYTGLTPARFLDTRESQAVGPDAGVRLQLTGEGEVPPDGVGAVVLNLTGTAASAGTFVTVYPDGAARPTASNLNLVRGQTAANLVVTKLSADGAIRLYNSSGTVHLIVDVVGWISTGLTGTVEKPAGTTIVPGDQVSQVDESSGDLTVTGAAPATGQFVFVEPGTSAAGTILGKVTGTTPGGGGTIVHTTPARLEEAFPSGEIHGSVDSSELAGPSALRAYAGRKVADRNGFVHTATGPVHADCEGSPITYDVNLGIHARFVLDVRWGLGSVDELSLVFELDVAGTITLTVGGHASCEIGLPPAIPLPPVWGFVPVLQPAFKLEFSGGLTLTSEVKGQVRVGAAYRNGGMQWIHSGSVSGTEPAPAAAGELTAKVTFGPKASVKFADAVGVSLFGGLFAESTVSTSGDPWWKVDGGLEVEVAFEADLWFTDFSYELGAYVFGRFQLARASGPWPGPRFTTRTLPRGEVGLAYDAALGLAGSPPLTVTKTAGTLPAGLSLSGSHLVGTPTAPAYAQFTLKVSDGAGRSAQQAFAVDVIAPGSSNVLPLPGSPPVHEFATTDLYLPSIWGPGPRGEVLLCGFTGTGSGLVRAASYIARDGSVSGPAPTTVCDNANFPRDNHFYELTSAGDTVWSADGWTYVLDTSATKVVRAYGPDGTVRWTYPVAGQTGLIDVTPDRTQLLLIGEHSAVLDPHTGAVKYVFGDSAWGPLAATADYFVFKPDGVNRGIGYRYRATGAHATGTDPLPDGFGTRPADETAALAARQVSAVWSPSGGDCGSDMERMDRSGPQWTVTVPPAYASCAYQDFYATGDGGGYLVQVSADRHGTTVTRVRPGGTIAWSRPETLPGGSLYGIDSLDGAAVAADATGRIAYLSQQDYACVAQGSAATCRRLRLTVLGADGTVLLSRVFEQPGYRVDAVNTFHAFVGGFGQVFVALNYTPADASDLTGPERSALVSVAVPFDGDWDFTRRYRTAYQAP